MTAGWIKVADRLPEKDTDVFVAGKYNDSLRHDVAGLFDGDWMAQGTEDYLRFDVTHWMPIPPIEARP